MMNGPRSAWLWFIELDGHKRALDGSDDQTGLLCQSLGEHFEQVYALRRSEAELAQLLSSLEGTRIDLTGQVGTLRAPAWPAKSFDCIALHDTLAKRAPGRTDLMEELTRLHSLLRPNGWLAMAAENPARFRPWRKRPAAIPRHRLARALVRAGFREVRCFFVAPSLAQPLTLVPEVKDSISAMEASDLMSGDTVHWYRRALAGLGFLSLLNPGYVMLARA